MSHSNPLTTEEIQSIYQTWGLVSSDLKGHGIKFFSRFFKEHPHYQKFFHGFANIPLNQLASNKKFQAHSFTIMSTIGLLVSNLEDPEVLSELLLKIGQNHIRHKLKIEDFKKLEKILLQYFSDELGNAYTSTSSIAWQKVLAVIINKIEDGLNANINSVVELNSKILGGFEEKSTRDLLIGILGFMGFITLLYKFGPKRHL